MFGQSSRFLPDDPVVFGSPEFETDGDVADLAFAPDGSLWSVEEPGVVRRWNVNTGKQLWHRQLSDLETLWGFGPDARLLAAASNELSVWNVGSGRLVAALPQLAWITAVGFGCGSNLVATGHDNGEVLIWDLARQVRIESYAPHRQAVSGLAFSADGDKLASAAEDKSIIISRVSDGERLLSLTGSTDRIGRLLWHPDGRWLISAGWEGMARVWDAVSGEAVILLNTHDSPVTALAVSANGRLLATAESSGKIHLWNCATIKRIGVFETSAEVHGLAFSANGKLLAAGGLDRRISIWNVEQEEARTSGRKSPRVQTSFSLSPGGARLVTNNGGRSCSVWDAVAREPIYDLTDKETIGAVACSPDGRWIAGAAGMDIHVWDARTGMFHATLAEHDAPPTTLAFSHDSRFLAAASSQGMSAWVWDVELAKPNLLIPDVIDGCAVQAVAFKPPRGMFRRALRRKEPESLSRSHILAAAGIDWLATGGSDGVVRFWEIESRSEVASFSGGATALAFHPSGRRMVSATLDFALVLWDTATEDMIGEFDGHDGVINCLAFSPDGTLLASGGDDRTVRLWDMEHGEAIAIKELDSQVKAVSFSPDGRHLFTGNANTTCYKMRTR